MIVRARRWLHADRAPKVQLHLLSLVAASLFVVWLVSLLLSRLPRLSVFFSLWLLCHQVPIAPVLLLARKPTILCYLVIGPDGDEICWHESKPVGILYGYRSIGSTAVEKLRVTS